MEKEEERPGRSIGEGEAAEVMRYSSWSTPSSWSAPGRSLYFDNSAIFCLESDCFVGAAALPMNRIEGTCTSPWYVAFCSTRKACALVLPNGGGAGAFAPAAKAPAPPVRGRMTGMIDGGRRGAGPVMGRPGSVRMERVLHGMPAQRQLNMPSCLRMRDGCAAAPALAVPGRTTPAMDKRPPPPPENRILH
eukprot:927677-Rhodomonas_salina.11